MDHIGLQCFGQFKNYFDNFSRHKFCLNYKLTRNIDSSWYAKVLYILKDLKIASDLALDSVEKGD